MSGHTARTARTATPDAWVWSAAQGMYYHGPSDTYALPSAGGEWTYVAAKDMAGRSARGNGSEDREEGEIDDEEDEDSGWGALMAPEKLARITAAANNGSGGGRDRGVPYAPGHDPYGRDRDGSAAAFSTRTTPPAPDPSAHLLRLVVKRSKALPIGGIAVLDAREGGIQVGRDRRAPGDPPRVRVREMEVSKVHALVYRGSDGSVDPSGATTHDDSATTPNAEGWHIVDLGSTLGTYVAQRGEPDATRLSEPKHASRPYPLHHLARVTLGTTTFVAHIHDDWPCGECQLSGGEAVPVDDGGEAKTTDDAGTSDSGPAAFDAPVGAAARRGQRQFKRKRAMDALRDTLLGDDGDGHGGRGGHGPGEGYIDRSAQRRKLHPPSPPRRNQADTAHSGSGVLSVPAGPAGPSAASRAMLAKQGWTPGAGLGRAGDGRADAIVPVLRNDRVGLGARGQIADRDPAAGGDPRAGDWRVRGTQRRWDEITKEA